MGTVLQAVGNRSHMTNFSSGDVVLYGREAFAWPTLTVSPSFSSLMSLEGSDPLMVAKTLPDQCQCSSFVVCNILRAPLN
jgi:hypothetical protein